MSHASWSSIVDRLLIALFMVAYVASALSGASGYDTARDVAAAFAIRHLQAIPLHGPMLGGTLHLGPLWFYLLALPMALHESWTAVALFVGVLGSVQFPLAYATGRRLLDRRFGLLWCAMLALPGWGTFELVGFGHTSGVRLTTMLVIYALVRLAQERQPKWLMFAVFAWMLALHAHPTTVPLALAIAAVAAYALRDRGTLARWGTLSLALAALLLAPAAIEYVVAPANVHERPGDYLMTMVSLGNLANVPALLYGVLARGPQIMAGSFFAWGPGIPVSIWVTVVALEVLAAVGFILAFPISRSLAVQGLVMFVVTAATIVLARPATPFYMTFALLPYVAGIGALGLHRVCELTGSYGRVLAGTFVTVLLALHVASVVGVAQSIASGQVTMSPVSRLDVKSEDTTLPHAETWLPAYAVARSGALLCAQANGVVLHGMYAYLEDTYFGLDHRLACGAHDVRLLGAMPETATHLVGLASPLWAALGWKPPLTVGGMGVAPVAKVIAPKEGHAVPNGLTYPPYPIPSGPARAVRLDAVLGSDEVLVISFPFITWLPEPVLRVTVDGQPVRPIGRDAVSVLYACHACATKAMVNWHIEFESAAPEWIDVLSVKPAG